MIQIFGHLPSGTAVEAITLGSAHGLLAEILTLGGILRSLSFPVEEKRVPLVLTLPTLYDYLADEMYLGQIVGRYANRIANASFPLDGANYALSANDGSNTLHGGRTGFGKQVWQILDMDATSHSFLKLGFQSPAGTDGFPGNLDVTAVVRVQANSLSLELEVTTDAPTPISLTWHPYFNLSGNPCSPVNTHWLRVDADRYLPADSSWLATGEILPVDQSDFDFRRARQLVTFGQGSAPSVDPPRLNYYWVRNPDSDVAAEIFSRESRIRMRLSTNSPGMQVYDGFALPEQYPGKNAICLEPGNFPNAPNHPNFPGAILQPGQRYRQFMSYTFSSLS